MIRLVSAITFCCLAAADYHYHKNGFDMDVELNRHTLLGEGGLTAGTRERMGGHTVNQHTACRQYLAVHSCRWTLDHSCPGQTLGSKGQARQDSSHGYKCCCLYGFWRSAMGPPTTPQPMAPVAPVAPAYSPPTPAPGPVAPAGQPQVDILTGRQGIWWESIPRYIKLKYKLLQWFENQKKCPLHLSAHGFPAWVGWKAVMAAAPAVTTPAKDIAGWRTLEVLGFCPKVSSTSFRCVKTATEIKANVINSNQRIKLDQLECPLQDIVLYKLANGFVGVRFDFGGCTGHSHIGSGAPHQPKTASMNMQLGYEQMSFNGTKVETESARFSDFFKAVCGGAGAPPADFLPQFLPKFLKTVPTRRNQFETCFAESANAAHVIGKGCYKDFLFFDLQDSSGRHAQIPAADYAGLVAMIPGVQALVRPAAWEPHYVPSPPPPPPAAPKQKPAVYNSPCATYAPTARKLAGSPCTTVAPPPGPAPPAPAEPSPCTTMAPPTTTPPPPPPPVLLSCANVVCPAGTTLIPNAASVMCTNPQKCAEIDVYKCCAHVSPDAPGVVIQDRICLYWEDCSCDDNCQCSKLAAHRPGVTTTQSPLHPVGICRDFPWENLIIGAIAMIIAWRYCLRAFEYGTINWMPGNMDTTVCCCIPWGIKKKYTIERVDVGPWKRPHQGGIASVAIQSMSMAGSVDGGGDGDWTRTTTTEVSADFFKILAASFWTFGIITFVVVHLVWAIWMAIFRYALKIWLDGTWNSIDLYHCPTSLLGVWTAMWLMTWLALCYLKGNEFTINEATETKTVRGLVAAGGGGGFAGGGGGGGGAIGTLMQSVGLR